MVAAELAAANIGAGSVAEGRAGVSFRGTLETGYKANLWLRSAVRVLVKMASADMEINPDIPGQRGGDAVYTFVKEAAPWAEVIPPRCTFAVDVRAWDCDDIRNDMMAATRAKDAICDALRDATGTKPDPPKDIADVPLFLSLYRNKATLYRDLSGRSLHKRGYRENMPIHKSGLNESVAAGILSVAGWVGSPLNVEGSGSSSRPVLMDPMCGSGTLLIEGALMASAVAPGLFRPHWPFETWPDHDSALWKHCIEEAVATGEAVRSSGAPTPLFVGNDWHEGSLRLTEGAARAAGVWDRIALYHSDVRNFTPEVERVTHVACNPPWGLRLQGPEEVPPAELLETWFQLGCFLRKHAGGATAHVLTGNPEPVGKLFMTVGRRIPVTVGGIECRLLRYDVRERSAAEQQRAAGGEAGQAAARGASDDDSGDAAAGEELQSSPRRRPPPRGGGAGGSRTQRMR